MIGTALLERYIPSFDSVNKDAGPIVTIAKFFALDPLIRLTMLCKELLFESPSSTRFASPSQELHCFRFRSSVEFSDAGITEDNQEVT
jgi:hypothetical protein